MVMYATGDATMTPVTSYAPGGAYTVKISTPATGTTFKGLALGIFLIVVGMGLDLGFVVQHWGDVLTAVVLVLISRNAAWIKANMPASLGKPFFPGS